MLSSNYFCMMQLRKNIFFFCLLFAFSFLLSACTHIDLYEKMVPVPKQEWQGSFKPVFKFTITDTTSPYQLFLLFRHTDKYDYNNLWVTVTTKIPGSDSTYKAQYELPLASNDKGWLATGMDDIYDHRIALTPPDQKFYFKKAGEYQFTVEHIMREDPLQQVLNIGLRIEKKVQP